MLILRNENRTHYDISNKDFYSREIVMNGTLKQQPDKSLALNSLFSVDQKVNMDVEIKSTTGVPLGVSVLYFLRQHSCCEVK